MKADTPGRGELRVAGWVECRLDDPDVSTIIMGQSPDSTTYNGSRIGLPFFQGKADFGLRYPFPKTWCSEPGRIAERGDILVSVRAPVGDANIAAEKCCIGRGIAALRPGPRVYGDFLFLSLLHHKPNLDALGSGAIFKAINKEALQAFEIELPPLPEQRAIAAVLSKIQAAVEVQEKIVAALKELKAATMAKLFREGLRGEPLKQTEIGEIPESWKVIQLGSIARIGNGSTPKRDNLSYWENGAIPWLTSAKVHESVIEFADEFVSDAARAECHLPLVKKGSIVVAITGQGKTLGNAALVKFDTCVSQHLAYVQFETKEVLPEFMLFFLQGRYEHLRQVSQSGGSTKGALTCAFLKGYWVPIPPLQEQSQIASIVSSLLMKLRTEEAHRRALDALFSSMLHLLMTSQVRVRAEAQLGGEAATMQPQLDEKSHGSAVPAKLRAGVERFVAELVRRFEPERVILFGPHVEESPKARGEVCLLVVMDFEGRRLAQAVQIEREIPHEFSLDLLVERPGGVCRAMEIGNPLIRGIVEQGKVLYARPEADVGVPAGAPLLERARRVVPKGKLSKETLREIVRRIVEVVAPEKIIVFGSAARGEMGPDSDVDLLVVKSGVDRQETARTLRQSLLGIGIAKDVIVATPEDLLKYGGDRSRVISSALREGKVVYAA